MPIANSIVAAEELNMPHDREGARVVQREPMTLNEDDTVHDWAAKFGFTPDDERAAVKVVGDRVEDV